MEKAEEDDPLDILNSGSQEGLFAHIADAEHTSIALAMKMSLHHHSCHTHIETHLFPGTFFSGCFPIKMMVFAVVEFARIKTRDKLSSTSHYERRSMRCTAFFSAFYFKMEAGGCIGVSMILSVFLGRVVSGSWYVFLKIKNKESEIY